MGNALLVRKGGGTSLEDLGFINVPDGDWKFKTGSKSISSKDESIIPISVNMTVGTVSGTLTFGSSFTWKNEKKVNNYNCGNINNWFHDGHGTANHTGTATTTIAFIPICYSMDLTATQNGFTSGTLTCWLEKE